MISYVCVCFISKFRIGIVKPLNQFLSTEFGQVNVTKKAFHKSHTRVTQLVEKLCQVRVYKYTVCLCVCVCVCVCVHDNILCVCVWGGGGGGGCMRACM